MASGAGVSFIVLKRLTTELIVSLDTNPHFRPLNQTQNTRMEYDAFITTKSMSIRL